MSRVIAFDSGVLSTATQRIGVADADACRQWISRCLQAGDRIIIPAIARYELRRELIRSQQTASLQRLEIFLVAAPDRYIPMTEDAIDLAAQLWATARQNRVTTAPPLALDADVIFVAQVRLWAAGAGIAETAVYAATTNVRHIGYFLNAAHWTNL